MIKKIKALFYGPPGVGKSVFVLGSSKPFYITTDGNYEWLDEFGAKPEAHIQVNSWEEAKKAFTSDFEGYDTIVVDLIEDLFKWCEQEYCKRAKLDHISDVGYGKGYDITRNEFFLEISKLINKDKNVIFISHENVFVTKDRRGVEHTHYAPSSRIPDKVLDMIEGRIRYCLRCYMKAEEVEEGVLVKRRYLSLVPKENEFGIIRGVDETQIPHDIPLDWKEFIKAIGLDNNNVVENTQVKVDKEVFVKPAEEPAKVVEEAVEQPSQTIQEAVDEVMTPPIIAKQEEKTVEEQPKPQSNADKLAAIKAKLEAIKNANK